MDAARFPGRQGRLLFAYLVVAQGRPVPRDELAEALWGQALPATSDKALTVLVSKLRALLADAGLDGASALTAAFGCYRLGLPEGSWVDIVAAADAAREAERTLLAGDPARATAAASLAESVTRGPFLPGDSGAWVEQTRRELADLRGRVLGTLAEACLRSGEAAEASRWAEQAIALEPFRETGYRHLMQAHAVAGNRAEGLRVYERCRRLLAEELGAYPSPETESIYRRLLEGPPAPAEPHQEILQDPAPDRHPLAATRAGPPAAGKVRPKHRWRWLIAAGAATALAVGGLVAVLVTGHSRTGLAALPGNSVGMLGTDGVLRAAVPVGQSPEGVAATAKDVWVANAGDRTVSQISAKTRAVVQTVPVKAAPDALVVVGDDVWVVDGLAGEVEDISTRSVADPVVGSVTVGTLPSAIAYGYGSLWVTNEGDGTVSRIDPNGAHATKTITVGDAPDGIAVGAGAVWVANRADDTVTRINPVSDNPSAPIRVGAGPRGIAATGTGVWVANSLDPTVSHIDPAADRMDRLVEVGDTPTAIAADTDSIWVATAGDATVTRIDARTEQVTKRVVVGSSPHGLAMVGSTLWVSGQATPFATHRGGTLTLADDGGWFDSIDPQVAYADTSWAVTQLVYDTLVKPAPAAGLAGYELVPDLARTLPTPTEGGKTYTFTLRPGIRYSNGSPVRASDVRRGLERFFMQRPVLNTDLDVIVGAAACKAGRGPCHLDRGIVADDPAGTITFHLTAPVPDFLARLTLGFASAIPRGAPVHDVGTHPLPGTGPYKISRYTPQTPTSHESLTLVRNPYFRQWSSIAQPNGLPDVIRWVPAKTHTDALRDVEAGRADLTYIPFPSGATEAAQLSKRYPAQVLPSSLPVTHEEVLNSTKPPFDNPTARKAVAFALNRDPTTSRLLNGRPTCRLVPVTFPGYTPGCPYPRDLAEARYLVRESGTLGARVHVQYSNATPAAAIGRHVTSVLNQIGYHADLTLTSDPPGLVRNIGPSSPFNVTGTGWQADYPSITQYYTPLISCEAGSPLAGICNPALDKLAQQAIQTSASDPAGGLRLWQQLYQKLDADARIIATVSAQPGNVFISPRLRNYVVSPVQGVQLDQMWTQ